MGKKIHLIGNAHLDPVWLWQWQEGFAEIKATFRSALDRMKEFEDFKFTSACSVYYMWIEKSDKAMFDEIVERVHEGRWCIVGGWFLQPDCNIPCGESFARHGLISQRYFKDKFGVTAKTGYNVDSFGHNGSIPKILKQSGMDNYIFMRPMPHEKDIKQSLFTWESMDGSSVTTYRIPFFYNIDASRFEMFKKVQELDEGYDMMAFYGVGNHGGGPTVELLDRMAKELDDSFVQSTPNEYFDAVSGEKLPVVTGDLQFHAKGCYSACSSIKEGNRRSENEILNTEKYSVLSNKLINTPYPHTEIERAWQDILFNQFHDILGGCSIKEAYTDASYAHGEALNIAKRNSNFALQQISWNIDTMDNKELKAYKPDGNPTPVWRCEENIGTPVVVFNPLAFQVSAPVHLRLIPEYMTDDEGHEIPIQKVRDSKTNGEDKYGVIFEAEIPPLGYRVYRMYFKSKPEKSFESPFICSDNSIENKYIRLTFNEKSGELSEFFDKRTGREMLSGDTKTVFVDETPCDTWAHDVSEFKDIAGVFEAGSVKLIENGAVRAAIRSVMRLSGTEIIRDYYLEADSDTVLVKTKIDFHEKHKMLKFRIPVNTENPKAYAKIPFGFIERPNDGKEQVCGDWAALAGSTGGITLANSAQYSFDAEDNNLTLTVLRGAIYADHFGVRDEFCEYMEQGEHCFEYSVSPFKSLSDSEKKAEILNNKPTAVIETFHKGKLGTEYSGISVSEDNIAVTALKKHEDSGAYVLRCYESENRDTDVTIRLFDTVFTSHFSHSEVKTFIIDGSRVSECDFIEWRK